MNTKTKKVTMLNIGCGHAHVPLEGIREVRLDADASVNPDIVRDARKLEALPGSQYDGVWCSHLLEHFYEHEVPVVLRGILHVLKRNGVLFLFVPDLMAMMANMAQRGLGLNDVIYTSPMGPVRPRDMLYGFQPQVATGNEFYAHKTGFDNNTLVDAVREAGFQRIYNGSNNLQVEMLACKAGLPQWAAKYMQGNRSKNK